MAKPDDQPIDQPFCAPCVHFDGGACPVLRFVLDLHGQREVTDCPHRDLTPPDSSTAAGTTPA
jgi:hypothetical protein